MNRNKETETKISVRKESVKDVEIYVDTKLSLDTIHAS